MKRTFLGASLFLALAAPAHADSLVNAGGVLTFTGTTVDSPYLSISTYEGAVVVHRSAWPIPDRLEAPGCVFAGTSDDAYRCAGVTSVVVNAGSGDDRINTAGLDVPASVNGAAGDDWFVPGPGDTVNGGPGIDVASFMPRTTTGAFSLDGVADDGWASDAPLNLLADVEDLSVEDLPCIDWCPAPAPRANALTLTGNDAGNTLTGAYSNDTLIGGGGSDRLIGSLGDDSFLARDGVADRIDCGPGTDTAEVDQLDQVGDACEVVHRADVSPGLEDKPPVIAWAGATGLVVNAGDDYAVTGVSYLLDGKALCTAAVAPYTCAFTPKVTDVGRHTVVATATDNVGQTTSVVRVFTVDRFRPTAVTLKLRGRTASGKVTLPTGVPCAGKVRVGGKTVSLSKDCTYRATVKRAKSYVAQYLGTSAIAPKASKRVRA